MNSNTELESNDSANLSTQTSEQIAIGAKLETLGKSPNKGFVRLKFPSF
jgi:hypothetical protein